MTEREGVSQMVQGQQLTQQQLDELEAKASELLKMLDWPRYNQLGAYCAYYWDEVERLQADYEKLKHAFEVSEAYRMAYQKGKGELYALGEPFTSAAMKHLPCGEGALGRFQRRLLEYPRIDALKELVKMFLRYAGHDDYCHAYFGLQTCQCGFGKVLDRMKELIGEEGAKDATNSNQA